ncbi:MAG: DEAD/DEAH box helicase family protein [Chloroflexi bacterium]|nr:DEAD/DEAH box helicase family protein [Chloroflexota bacterium]MCL5075886.1 DEAD/DEAH box helicase family protein [Chloroflexota bacterium]
MAKTKVGKVARYSPGGVNQVPLLQDRLVLNRYLCQLFGCQDFRGLREVLRDQKEGWAEDGHSYFLRVLEGLQGSKLAPDQLAAYDLRIKEYVEQLNRFRTPPVQLKYFQYLAVLFTEIYLDRLFGDQASLLSELNKFIGQENSKLSPATPRYQRFTEADLSKLAFWMATGSGKTLVMHINLWQYLHYGQGKAHHENVLLVTPNEGLSRQHLDELQKSGIAARHYGEAGGSSLFEGGRALTVIEITKLTETKRGGGLSIEVDAFGPNNLLFVDEGHRGASGEVWRELRRRLAERGFTFEYSATFGQIVNGAGRDKRPALLEEYSKAILFDYSYPHFYHDGYGKDYWITNLKDETDTFNDWMLLGNLLSFYEQYLLYEEHRESFRPYNLEKPLWVFVGHTVTGGKSQEDKESLTDVEQIVAFFDGFLRHRSEWTRRIAKALRGETGLKNRRDEDIFIGQFPYLKEKGLSAEDIYEGVVGRILWAQTGESVRAVELKAAAGEIGLRAGADSPYFGVINIGDVAGLMKLLEARSIVREEENITGSLFTRINEANSPVNVLIGSRKFMEGWDSFRVSSMGLMNIGKGEGAQIIQLFGRGVRLWGKALSLKRSSAIEPDGAAPNIRLLETLNVFGVRANYMAQFREYLKQEGIETEFEEIHLPIQIQEDFLKPGLQVLRLPEGERFEDKKGIVLALDDSIQVVLDLRPRLELARSGASETEAMEKVGGEDRASLLRQCAPLFDWQRIYFDLLAFKRLKGFHNLSFGEASLREILQKGNYEVLCPDGQLPPSGYQEVRRAEDSAIAVLRKYVSAFYDRRRRAWEQENMRLAALMPDDPNLKFGAYTLRVKTADRAFLEQVRELVSRADEIYKKDVARFPNIHFDRHLYQPLLVTDKQERMEATPPALNEGEARFVHDLRTYLQSQRAEFEDKEIFLLRNLTRSRGIGFFEAGEGEAFYPDFILWLIQDQQQRVTFIDPHGLRMARGGFNDPKVTLHKSLKVLEPTLQQQCAQWQVHLASFILAPGSYEETRRTFGTGQHSREEFEEHNILFSEDSRYIGKLLSKVLEDASAEA